MVSVVKVLVYADFRSVHSRGWRAGLESAGIEVIAVSSERAAGYDASGPVDRLSNARQDHLDHREEGRRGPVARLLRRLGEIQLAHTVMELGRLRAQRRRLAAAIDEHAPDVVHAIRIPYEGLAALGLARRVPVVIATWGSDFVPMAARDPALTVWMRRLLPRAAGLQTDALADLERARRFGLPESAEVLYSASNFGVDDTLFHVAPRPAGRVVVYPRKAKANANYRGFVAAAMHMADLPGVRFVGVGLQEVSAALVREFGPGVTKRVELTGELDRAAMGELLRSATVVVSPTFWDGTPLSVLEAVASGAAVVAGELPELRRLRDEGMLIDLIDAADERAIERGIRRALNGHRPDRIAASLPDMFRRSATKEAVAGFYARVVAADGR